VLLRVRHRARPTDSGFTLIELTVAIAILGIIMVALVGVVIGYFKATAATAARLNESTASEFVAAYWQRDVSSVGVTSTEYCQASSGMSSPNGTYSCAGVAAHSFVPLNSVNISLASGCTPVPSAGTLLITLAWSEYTASAPTSPVLTAVSYYVNGSTLTRVRCSGGTISADTVLSKRLSTTSPPTVTCDGATCASPGATPSVVTMNLTVLDTTNDAAGTHPYNLVLTGERRQSS
jgi:prepilin-type N-terminal cleavage/methylation domain-containing protein